MWGPRALWAWQPLVLVLPVFMEGGRGDKCAPGTAKQTVARSPVPLRGSREGFRQGTPEEGSVVRGVAGWCSWALRPRCFLSGSRRASACAGFPVGSHHAARCSLLATPCPLPRAVEEGPGSCPGIGDRLCVPAGQRPPRPRRPCSPARTRIAFSPPAGPVKVETPLRVPPGSGYWARPGSPCPTDQAAKPCACSQPAPVPTP